MEAEPSHAGSSTIGIANVTDNIESTHFLIILFLNNVPEIIRTSVPLNTMPAIISRSDAHMSCQISAPEIRVTVTLNTLTGETLKYPSRFSICQTAMKLTTMSVAVQNAAPPLRL